MAEAAKASPPAARTRGRREDPRAGRTRRPAVVALPVAVRCFTWNHRARRGGGEPAAFVGKRIGVESALRTAVANVAKTY
jgi:hypothetical protein